jgi:hypothetical protein
MAEASATLRTAKIIPTVKASAVGSRNSRANHCDQCARNMSHSIIGNRELDKIPLNDSSDGVVPYWSSRLPGAVSERVVPAQHVTACQNPKTVEELRRILLLHLKAINN